MLLINPKIKRGFDYRYLAIKPTICNYNIIAYMFCIYQDFQDLDIYLSIAAICNVLFSGRGFLRSAERDSL